MPTLVTPVSPMSTTRKTQCSRAQRDDQQNAPPDWAARFAASVRIRISTGDDILTPFPSRKVLLYFPQHDPGAARRRAARSLRDTDMDHLITLDCNVTLQHRRGDFPSGAFLSVGTLVP